MIPLLILLTTVSALGDPFHPGQSDTLMTFLEENTVGGTDVHQGIQLFKGWNLVSFNIIDDPDPGDLYFIEEIFAEDFFDRRTDGSGPDAVCRFDHNYESGIWFPKTTYENTWLWEWVNEWAYMVHLDDAHLIQLSGDDWYDDEDTLIFTPDEAWDDSLQQGLPQQIQNDVTYWFFLGYSKSRQIEVLPDPESSGPFYDLYDANGTNYNNQTLRVVKSDDGRVFLPNYNQHGDDYDGIGFLEPGRGYSLGFEEDDEIGGGVNGPWPFCSEYDEERIDQGELKKYSTEKGVASGDPAQLSSSSHFLYKTRTHWWYPVMIDTLVIEGITPEPGDEIAVFDGQLCVGAELFQDELPLVIAAWKDDITTPTEIDGYDVGNEMIFKFYDKSENTEITFELPPSTQAMEDDPVRPRHSGFGAGFYAIRSLIDGILNINQLPREYSLGQNYPNPFNAETVIPLQLPERSNVKIDLYNICGQHITTIYDGVENAGHARMRYNASNLASGIYIVHVSCEGLERNGKFENVRKILLLK